MSWQHTLTVGQAEILLLLLLSARGPRGYRELEADLYTDRPGSSTARARWCRLREVLCGLLAGDDGHHAFAPAVTIEPVRYPSGPDPLPGSTAPGIHRLRRPE